MEPLHKSGSVCIYKTTLERTVATCFVHVLLQRSVTVQFAHRACLLALYDCKNKRQLFQF
jgi:hypothetical protein